VLIKPSMRKFTRIAIVSIVCSLAAFALVSIFELGQQTAELKVQNDTNLPINVRVEISTDKRTREHLIQIKGLEYVEAGANQTGTYSTGGWLLHKQCSKIRVQVGSTFEDFPCKNEIIVNLGDPANP
jgi:hypothetical protein